VQRIDAGTRVCIDVPVGFIFLPEIPQQLDEYRVFENVGVIACVKGVSVAEHGGIQGLVRARTVGSDR
jgi:hypothetical protein